MRLEAQLSAMADPLRDVISERKSVGHWPNDFRVLTLSCGHSLIRQPAQKIPLRARCHECGLADAREAARATTSETAPR